jgi:6-phosphogluconate dehydrogenase
MELALLGLGKMGGGMARRLLAAGHRVAAYSPSGGPAKKLAEEDGAVAASSLEEAVSGLAPSRIVWLMVPATAVGETLEALQPLLAAGDLVVDGGNSHFRDSQMRGDLLSAADIRFVDAGVSGGVRAELGGYCLMLGGEAADIQRLEPILEALARPEGWAHVGPSGAGHFVKMVHNGIEYGLMQAYAEGLALMKASPDLDIDLAQVTELWRHGSVVRSWLLDLVAEALAEDPELAAASSAVEDSGEGRWTVGEAVRLGVPTPVIAEALMARFASRADEPEGAFAGKVLTALRDRFGGHGLGGAEGA